MKTQLKTIAHERVSSEAWLPPWTRAEHASRYSFASTYVHQRAVVDCACGNGVGSAIFLRNDPISLHGFDNDAQSVARASQTCRDERAHFSKANAAAIPLPASSCDVFISLETIEHVQDDSSFVAEAARVLRPGGLFICSTPNRLVTNPGTTKSDKPWNPFHVREYSPKELSELLCPHFANISTYGQNPVWKIRVAILTWIGGSINRMLAVRLNQLWKCRWFFWRHNYLHDVQKCIDQFDYEYIVIVAHRRPHRD